jgi:hypothetical protein
MDILTGLICGVLFGWVLERSGFGSPCKLTAQFRLTDWSVLKVMFTAIVVAAIGISLAESLGWMASETLFVPPALLGAAAIGGLLVGAGFAIGGYCPGTSVVGAVSGRLDAWVFLLGLLVGTVAFATGFDAVFANWAESGEFLGGDTLAQALGISPWIIHAVLVAAVVAVFKVGTMFENKGHGAVTAAQAVQGASNDMS